MSIAFYWIWSVIGVLIILFVVVMSFLLFRFAKKAYDLVGLIYDEQQEVIGRIVRRSDKQDTPESEVEQPESEVTE